MSKESADQRIQSLLIEEDKKRTRLSLKVITYTFMTISIIVFILRLLPSQEINIISFISLFFILSSFLMLNAINKGYLIQASYIIISIIWFSFLFIIWNYDGLYDIGFMAFLPLILISAYILEKWFTIAITIASLLYFWLLAFMNSKGIRLDTVASPFDFARDFTTILVAFISMALLYQHNIKKSKERIAGLLYRHELDNERLNENEKRYREIYDAVEDAIFIQDTRNGNILDINHSAAVMFGYTMEDLISKNVEELSASDEGYTQTRAVAQIKLAIETGQSVFEWRSKKADGKVFWTEVQLKKSNIGGENRILAVVRDISERKFFEIKIEDQNKILKTVNDLALKLSAMPSDQNLPQFISKQLKEISNAEFVSFSEYEADPEKVLITRHLETSENIKGLAIQWLNRPVSNMVSVLSQNDYNEIVKKVIDVKYSLFDITFGSIPKPLSKILQGLLNIDRFLCLAFIVEGDLFGTAIMAMKSGTPDPSKELLQSCAHLAAVSIRRIKVEQLLKTSEDTYKKILETMQDVYYRTDIEGNLQMANPSALKTLGYDSIQEVIGLNTAKDFYHIPEQRTKLINDLKKHGSVSDFEVILKRKDGSLIHVETNSHFIFGRNGEIIGVEGIFRDITKRKATEEALIASEARLKSIVDSSFEGICFTTNGILNDANIQLAKMLQYEITELKGKKVTEFVAPTSIEYVKETIKNNEEGPYEHFAIRKDGTIFPVEIRARMLEIESQKVRVSAIRDITLQKQREQQIIKLNEELEQRVIERTAQLELANKDLEAFAYSVSHDLRAPLRHIDGFIKLLFSNISNPNDSITGYYKKINSASKRMAQMIDDLLEFSRLGRKELTKQIIDMNLLVSEVIGHLKPDTSNRVIEWKIQNLEDVNADKNLLKLAIENLLSNAIKYTSKSEASSIEIGNFKAEDNVVGIFIKDNGVGFDMAHSGKLFGVFQRLHSTEQFEGTGIGLANVRQIILKHKGQISAEGKPGEGAVFYITLPR